MTIRKLAMTNSNAKALQAAIDHLKEADVALCQVVASIAEARGWRVGESYTAEPLEEPWHALIGRVHELREELEAHRHGG